MKINTKDIYIFFFMLVFIVEGITYFRLNQLEKVTNKLIDANAAFYEIYRIERQLNKFDILEEELYPIYPRKRGN